MLTEYKYEVSIYTKDSDFRLDYVDVGANPEYKFPEDDPYGYLSYELKPNEVEAILGNKSYNSGLVYHLELKR